MLLTKGSCTGSMFLSKYKASEPLHILKALVRVVSLIYFHRDLTQRVI